MKKRTWTAVAALVAIAGPVGTRAAEPGVQKLGTVTHVATGFQFPEVVGGFNRVSIHAFNSAATDVSIGYASLTPGAQVAVTVYITPAPAVDLNAAAQARSCEKQFAAMDNRIAKAHPDARQLVRGDTRSPSSQYDGTGKQVIYDYEDMFYGQKQTLRSETDLYCYVGGDWLIAYRATAPIKVDYAPKLANFMRALAWPMPGSGKPVASVAPTPAVVAETRPPAVQPTPAAPAVKAPPAAPVFTADGNRVLVRLKADKSQAALAGLVVSGSEADLVRFETAASQHGVDARRMTENGKTETIASLLKPQIKLADASDLYRHARDGKFGKVKLEVLLLPPGSSGEERDLLGRAAILPASALDSF